MDHDPRRGSGCQAGVARSRGWILAPCAEAPKGEEAEEGEEEEGAGRRGTGLMVLVNRLARLEDFNPRSSQQMLAYLKAKGYPIPKDRKDKTKETTGKEGMRKLLR